MFTATQKKAEEAAEKESLRLYEESVARVKVTTKEIMELLKTKEHNIQEVSIILQSCEQAMKSQMGQLKYSDVVKS
jgi:hypothetical protein